VSCGVAQSGKIAKVCAGKRAFAVYIGTQKSGTKRFEHRHDVARTKRQGFPPAVRGDFALVCVQGDDNTRARKSTEKRTEKAEIGFASVERGAADDDLRCSALNKAPGAGNGADATADPDFHFVLSACALAERFG
jgi:hypothetical protein